jgi:hypothetical protein
VAHSAAWSVAGSGTAPATAADFAGGVLPSGTVTFAAGETSKTITVAVAADHVVEANEGFAVTLSSPSSGASIGTASTSGTIVNDDVARAGVTLISAGLNTATMSFIPSLSAAGSVVVDAGAATEMLMGDRRYDTLFRGTAAQLNGDTIGLIDANDQIDVTDLAFGTAILSYTPGPAQSLLNVSDGLRAACITLTGSLTANGFHMASDGHGGTLIAHA